MRKFPSYNLNRNKTGKAKPADRIKMNADIILVKIILLSFKVKNEVFIMKQRSVKCFVTAPHEVFSKT